MQQHIFEVSEILDKIGTNMNLAMFSLIIIIIICLADIITYLAESLVLDYFRSHIYVKA